MRGRGRESLESGKELGQMQGRHQIWRYRLADMRANEGTIANDAYRHTDVHTYAWTVRGTTRGEWNGGKWTEGGRERRGGSSATSARWRVWAGRSMSAAP